MTVPTMGKELTLYLFTLPIAVGVVLIKEEDRIQIPVYYVNKVLLRAENIYLKIGKLTYVLKIAARKLFHYFQTHPVIVLTDQPLKKIFQ